MGNFLFAVSFSLLPVVVCNHDGHLRLQRRPAAALVLGFPAGGTYPSTQTLLHFGMPQKRVAVGGVAARAKIIGQIATELDTPLLARLHKTHNLNLLFVGFLLFRLNPPQ